MRLPGPGLRSALLIVAVAALAYLPLAASFGYSHDDWYLMYAARANGPQAFHAIFSIDRPLRAYVMIPAYELFGESPFWYQLSAFAFRCLGAIAFWWLLRMLWPKAGRSALLAALVFAVYPGFLSQPNPIDYQSQIVALGLAMLSLALTVRYFLVERLSEKMLLLGGAVLSGWVYLGLVEYFLGFELIRFALMLLLALRERNSPAGWLRQVLRWLPFALIAGLFLFWRLYIFTSERGATDVDAQFTLSRQAVWSWPGALLNNFLDVVLYAWFVPLGQLLPGLDLARILVGLFLAGLAVALVLLFQPSAEDGSPSWHTEALLLGLVCSVAGLTPIILVNRSVSFPEYSRYTLAASMGAALLCAWAAYSLPAGWARQTSIALFLALAVFTHHANSVRYALETASMNAFWWQVSWRVPQLLPGTTLVAHYPVVSPQEDYFIWGPANLIYYPEALRPDVIQPDIYAAIPNDTTTERVLQQVRQVYDKRRTILTYANYRNILILTQPGADSCVQVIDGAQPELSSREGQRFILMAPFSETEHILAAEGPHVPPRTAFGDEPPRGWCFYYEKASLARQREDWAEVLRLAVAARRGGFVPADQVEWMPFLQAYARQGDLDSLASIEKRLTDLSVREQVCMQLKGMSLPDANLRERAKNLFCSP